MLVVSRRKDESIMIGDDVKVIIVDIRSDKVRLGIEAPQEIPVHRQEVLEAIQRENNRLGIGSPDLRLEDMNEPQLREHFDRQIRLVKANETSDTIGSMLVTFQENGIAQYAATVLPDDAPAALRELADRLEKRETVGR